MTLVNYFYYFSFSLNRRGYVPDVILATIELPEDLPVVGIGCLIQASVCRPKRDLRSESNAKEISDGLPFLGKQGNKIRAVVRCLKFQSFHRIRIASASNQ